MPTRKTVPRPMTFQIRPATKGLNVSDPPQTINLKETPRAMNTRVEAGNLQGRTGFAHKYWGPDSPPIWMDLAYAGGQTVLLIFTRSTAYLVEGEVATPCAFYDTDGTPLLYPQFSLEAYTDYMAIDVGQGKFEFHGANGAWDPELEVSNPVMFPAESEVADLMVYANGVDGEFFVGAYTGGATAVEFERIADPFAPSGARTATVFDNRLFVGGDENDPTRIHWSSKGRWDIWDPATAPYDAGSTVLGDSPDWVQIMRKLGDYLIVYKERSILMGMKTGLVDPPVRFEPAPGQGIGLAAPNSIGDLGEEHIFLGWDDVYVFSLRHINAVGSRIKQELFYGEHGILPKHLPSCTGVIAEEYSEYWLFVPTGKWPSRGGDDDLVNHLLDPKFSTELTAHEASWTLAATATIAADISHTATIEYIMAEGSTLIDEDGLVLVGGV